jgi:hypothetical protein
MPSALSPSIARMVVVGALNSIVEWWNPAKSSIDELSYTMSELLSSALSGTAAKADG